MIAATDRFRESVDAALISVEALHAAIDDLPELKVINIRVETTGMPEAAAAAAGAGGMAPDTAGMAAEAAAADAAGDAADEADAKFRMLSEAEIAAANAALANAAALSAEAAAARAAGDAVGDAAVPLDATRAAYRDLVDEGVDPLDAAFMAVREHGGGVTDTMAAAAAAADDATVPFAAVGDAARDVGDGLVEAGADAERTAGGFGLLGAAATGIVDGFARVETTWKNTNVVWGLSLNALHWIVMGSMELLAVAVPAMIAFGAAADVGLQGAVEAGQRLQSTYTVTESLGDAFNTTGGEAIGLKGNLQAAQDAADPEIWELLGAAINGVKDTSGGFVQMGTEVISVLDRWAAAVDVELAGSMGKTLNSVVSEGTQDLTAFGEVLGNIGHFILNLASEMPGLAEVLLGAVAGFTKLLAVLTNPAWYNFGGNLVTVAMGIEEAWRWGGLLSNVLGTVSTKFSAWGTSIAAGLDSLSQFGRDAEDSEEALTGWRAAAAGASEGALGLAGGLESAGAVLSGPWGWVIMGAVAGLALLTIKLATTRTAAQQFADGLQNAVNSSDMTDAFTKIGSDLTQLQTKMQQTGVAADHTSSQITASGSSFKGLGANVGTAIAAYNAYSDTSSKMVSQDLDMIDAGKKISSSFGISLPAAFEAADMAGVKVGQMFQKNGQISATALQQIQNYIDGYKVMSGNAGALSNNIDAVNVQLGLQGSQVSKLNQAWDQFTANTVGGTAAWATFNDDLQQMGNTAGIVGTKITAFSGKTAIGVKQISQALTSFSGTSAQVWQSFDASITQANTNLDWWRTAAASGAASGKQLTEATATTAGAFLPYIKNSQAALSETMQIAQEQGGPAYNASKSLAQNYQALSTWVQNNSVSQSQYNQMLGSATTALSNVNTQAQQFSQTLRGDVSQAIITGSGALAQVTSDTEKFSSALKNNVPQSQAVKSATSALTDQLVRDGYNAQSTASMIYQLSYQQTGSKNTAQQAATQAYNMANAFIKAGGNANSLAGSVNHATSAMWNGTQAAWAMAQAVNDIPNSKNVYVNVQEAITGTVGVGGILPTPSGHAAGWRVPGYGGGDIHPALLEGGESVVPKELTPAVAPFLKSHGVPGFAAGGIMGSGGDYGSYGGGGGGYSGPARVTIELNGRRLAEALMPDLVGAVNRTSRRNNGVNTGKLIPGR